MYDVLVKISGIVKGATVNKIDTYLGVPYIGSKGHTRIHSSYVNPMCNIKFYHNTVIIKTFYDDFINIQSESTLDKTLFDEMCGKLPSTSTTEPKYLYFQCNSNKIQYLIYFDHKIADDLSVLQKFLLFGSYNSKRCTLTSLINNCPVIFENIPRNIKQEICETYIPDFNTEKYNQYICIKTFYKTIDYVDNNREKIDKSQSIIFNYYKYKSALIEKDAINETHKKYLKYKKKYINLKYT
jgi:hypothetical protein